MGKGNAAVSQRAQKPILGYASGDDEPELYHEIGSVVEDRL